MQNLGTPCKGVRVVTFCVVQKVTKKHARTCKKLPVASFCASETAETGRIANGREQGDHVSRRKGAIARAACRPDRGKLPACQEVPEGKRFCVLFASAKRTKKQTGFHPATPVQIAGRNDVLDKMTGFYQVTGYERTTISHSIDGNDLNRCELQA